jgi:nucleoside phosphorylase
MPTIAVNRPKLLVVAAWEPELARFRERIRDAAPQKIDLVLATLGVGLVEAAIAMTQCVARHQPSAALLIGTCGAFERPSALALAPGAVVTGARVRLLDGSTVEGTAALPTPMPAEAIFDAALRDALVAAGAKSVQIANTVGITTDDALASRLWRAGDHDVEHLEAFAFARACAAAELPCGVALGVANMVGARGREEWLANHVAASARAADVAFDGLGSVGAWQRLASRARG